MIAVIGLTGFTGRMGQAIVNVIENHPEASLGGGLVRHGQPRLEPGKKAPRILTDNPEDLFPHCDVIVDFSHPSATPIFARLAGRHGKPFLSGTTGLDENGLRVLRETAEKIPLLHTTNTSLSLVVARHAAMLAADLLQDYEYDISILDKHHKWKKDAPSGTALTLGQAIASKNGGRHDPTYASVRTGSIIGEHEILFSGAGESVMIQHTVTDRRVFARGAVQAAIWLSAQEPGFYGMDNVLGL